MFHLQTRSLPREVGEQGSPSHAGLIRALCLVLGWVFLLGMGLLTLGAFEWASVVLV
jgi:hypothetical protein